MSWECDIRFITLPFPILKSREKSPSGDIRFIALVVVSDITLGQSQDSQPRLRLVLDSQSQVLDSTRKAVKLGSNLLWLLYNTTDKSYCGFGKVNTIKQL